MASNAWKWVAGCGIGCAVVALLVAGLSVGGFFFVKDAVKDVVQEVEQAERAQESLKQRFGEVDEFTPWPDGAIPAERIEAFLLVRDRMAPARGELEQALSALGGSDSGGGGALAKVRAGVGLVPRLIGFYTDRAVALSEGEMGTGEYLYLYLLVYYAWLEKSPADGPPFQLVSDDQQGHGWRSEFGDADPSEVRERRLKRTLPQLNRLGLPLLRNQLAALDASESPIDAEWRETLAAEIRAVEADPDRLPWQDGPPAAAAASLAPFRDRLTESYSELCNVLEATTEEI